MVIVDGEIEMTTRETVWNARENLLSAMQVAFDRLGETNDVHDAVLRKAMSREFERVEKFLGFVPGSWRKGS